MVACLVGLKLGRHGHRVQSLVESAQGPEREPQGQVGLGMIWDLLEGLPKRLDRLLRAVEPGEDDAQRDEGPAVFRSEADRGLDRLKGLCITTESEQTLGQEPESVAV